MSENVKVAVRCRPISSGNEKSYGVAVQFDDDYQISLRGSDQSHTFRFDRVYNMESHQRDLYDDHISEVIEGALQGYNGTVFAYGQTGSGKTHTMSGPEGSPGIIPRCFAHIFARIQTDEERSYAVRVSFVEIYMESVRDLFVASSKNLGLRESVEAGVYVEDLSSFICRTEQDMHHRLTQGNARRTTAATAMNQTSSRSHAIFSVHIEAAQAVNSEVTRMMRGKLHLVDLAGSERQSKSEAVGLTLKEAAKINLSLLTLGSVISALASQPRPNHIPYRDSKLTRLLEDSLGGNAKTVMIATVSPSAYNTEETLQTLRYANRVKAIVNKPHVNTDVKDRLISELQRELEMVRAQATLPSDLEEIPLVKMLRAENVKMKALLRSAERAAIEAEIKMEEGQKRNKNLQEHFEQMQEENRHWEAQAMLAVQRLKELDEAAQRELDEAVTTGPVAGATAKSVGNTKASAESSATQTAAGGSTTTSTSTTTTSGMGVGGPTSSSSSTGTSTAGRNLAQQAADGLNIDQQRIKTSSNLDAINTAALQIVPFDPEFSANMRKDADALRSENEELLKALASAHSEQDELLGLREKEQYLLRQEAELVVDKNELLTLKDELASQGEVNAQLLSRQEELLEIIDRLSKQGQHDEASWQTIADIRARDEARAAHARGVIDTHNQFVSSNQRRHSTGAGSGVGSGGGRYYSYSSHAPPGGVEALHRYPETVVGGSAYRHFQAPGVAFGPNHANANGVAAGGASAQGGFTLTPNTQQTAGFRYLDNPRASAGNNATTSAAAATASRGQGGGEDQQSTPEPFFVPTSSSAAPDTTGRGLSSASSADAAAANGPPQPDPYESRHIYKLPFLELTPTSSVFPIPLPDALKCGEMLSALASYQHLTAHNARPQSTFRKICATAAETLREAEKLEFKLRGSTNLVGRAAAVIGWRKNPVDSKTGEVPKEVVLKLVQLLDRVIKLRTQFLFEIDRGQIEREDAPQVVKKLRSCAEILGVTIKTIQDDVPGTRGGDFADEGRRFAEERGQPNVRPGGAVTALPQVNGATPR
eukprot:CAMPEP_0178988410 /NCGR_PEP_ID=MMETSP0795-20121207/3797_1 /TAXON_ID=88552 /ORGANISM="Amoebophrya sp., Strain Ameob2" /LENGTH=1050 /DNA_ID=CAMNT_0020679685 /DNA_START=417 /DNA_END=3569 /DNA_ORIENTATION=-